MTDWKTYRQMQHTPRDRKLRPKNTCPFCPAQVIWARVARIPRRFGGRHYVPIPLERCQPGTGDYSLSMGLFLDSNEAPVAEKVAIGTSYRSHRDHCPAFAKSAKPSNSSAAAPKAFSAANFSTKKPARGGNR